ncbi:MAG: hypothetical protein AAB426_10540, partial [Myxococcota bacterium]
RSLFPTMRFGAGGVWDLQHHRPERGELTASDEARGSLHANLLWGGPLLSLAAAATHRQDRIKTVGAPRVGAVDDAYSVVANYSPTELPQLTARFTLGEDHDLDRRAVDRQSKSWYVSTTYAEIEHVDARYTYTWTAPTDRLLETSSTQQRHAGRLGYSDRLFEGRSAVQLDYNVSAISTDLQRAGRGVLSDQVFPIGGLTLVESFPFDPEQAQLVPEPAVIDGDTTTPVAIDLGTSRALGGDTEARDIGIQLADLRSTVNRVWVWVDAALSAEVAAALTWTAYVSSDNLTWTSVPITEAVTFGTFQNRFEIGIADTRATYLKVVTRPLPAAATSDPAFASVRVTEIQVFNLRLATDVPRHEGTLEHSLAGAARTRLLRDEELYHDVACRVIWDRRAGVATTLYQVSNGLMYAKALRYGVVTNARLARADTDHGAGRAGVLSFSAGATASPLPRLLHNLIYSGTRTDGVGGAGITQAVSFTNHAEPFRVIALEASATQSLGHLYGKQRTSGQALSCSASVTPHPSTAFGVTYGVSRTTVRARQAPTLRIGFETAGLSMSTNPVRSLYVSGGISRAHSRGQRPRTIGNAGAGFSPFPGGALQLNFVYSESVETETGGRTRMVSPTLRWNIRPGTFLDAAYSYLASASQAGGELRNQSFAANLTVAL